MSYGSTILMIILKSTEYQMELFLLLLLISFLNRIIIVLNTKTDFDTFGHLYFLKEVKDQKVGPFGTIQTKVSGSKGFKAPFLWHWFFGLLPVKFVLKYQKWINPILDIVFTMVIYLLSLLIGLSEFNSFLVGLLYLFTPMWFSRISTGPRIKSLTPRLSSELLTNLFFIVTLLPLEISVSIRVILGMILCMFVIQSSKFGLQAFLLLTPIVSIFTLNPIPIYSLLAGILASFVITKGHFIETLKNQFMHLKWYFQKNLNGEMPISNRNRLSNLFSFSVKESKLKNIKSAIIKMLTINSFTAVLLKMPVVLLSLTGILYLQLNEMTNALTTSISGVVIGATMIYLLVNIPLFLFIGEAERYLNHIAYFIVAIAVLFIDMVNMPTVIYILLLYGLVYWVYESFFLGKTAEDDKSEKKFSDEVFNFLETKKAKSVVITYPYHAIGGVWRIMLYTKHQVVCYMASDREYRKKLEDKYALNYPYLNLNLLKEMSDEFGVNILIIENKHLKINNLEGWTPPSNWKETKIGGSYYRVYEKS